jgi:uncharacterized protein
LHKPVAPASFKAGFRRDWRGTAEALAIGAVGGLTFGWLGLPAGYLSGAMLAVALASLFGRPLKGPSALMHITSAVIGTTLGSAATPGMMHGLGAYPVSLAVLGASTVAVVFASAFYLRVVHAWDTLSSILAATPGGLTQMVALAVETRSDAVGVSIAQTLRVVLLVAFLPVILAFFGYSIGAGGPPRVPMAALSSLPTLVAGSLLTGYLFFRLHFPGGWLFGAMFGSGLLHGFGIVQGGLPPWVVSAATIGVGTMAGIRFAGLSLQTLLRYLAAGAGSLLVATLVMAAFLLLDIWIAGIRVQDGAMSFAPGAMDVMMTVALTMHLDPVFVGAHHLFRFLAVSVVMPFIIRAVAPKLADLPESEI